MPTVTRADFTQNGDAFTFIVQVDLEGELVDPSDLSERVLLAVLDAVRGS